MLIKLFFIALFCSLIAASDITYLQNNIIVALLKDGNYSSLGVINATTGTLVPSVSWDINPPVIGYNDFKTVTLFDAKTTSYCYSALPEETSAVEWATSIYCINLTTSTSKHITFPLTSGAGVYGMQSYEGVIYVMTGVVGSSGLSDAIFYTADIVSGEVKEYFSYKFPKGYYAFDAGVVYANLNNTNYLFTTAWSETEGLTYWVSMNVDTKEVTLNTDEDCSIGSYDSITYYNGQFYGLDFAELDVFHAVSEKGKSGNTGLIATDIQTAKHTLTAGDLNALISAYFAHVITL